MILCLRSDVSFGANQDSCFYDGDDRCEPKANTNRSCNDGKHAQKTAVWCLHSHFAVSWMLNLGKQTLKMFDVKQMIVGHKQQQERDK